MSHRKVGSDPWAANVACGSRLSLRKFRNTGDTEALQRHEEQRALLEEHGFTMQFGIYGWDDAMTSPDFVAQR